MSRKLLTFVIIAILIASVLLAACSKPVAPTTPAATTPAAQVTKLSMSAHSGASPSIYYTFHKNKLPVIVERVTNGRIKLDPIYGAGELVNADQLLEACSRGTLDVIECTPSYYKGTIPVGEVEQGLPAAFMHGWDHYEFLYQRGAAQILEEEYAKNNVRWLAALIGTHNHLINSKRKITSLADFKGAKVATFGAYITLMTKLGGAGMSIPVGERYTALATGAADAAFTTAVAMYDLKFYEVAKYLVLPNFTGTSCDTYSMNLDAYKKLSPDMQDVLTAAFREAAVYWGMDLYMLTSTNLEKWKAQGTELVTWSDADFAKVVATSQEYWDEVAAKDAATKKAVDIMKSLLRELGRIK